MSWWGSPSWCPQKYLCSHVCLRRGRCPEISTINHKEVVLTFIIIKFSYLIAHVWLRRHPCAHVWRPRHLHVHVWRRQHPQHRQSPPYESQRPSRRRRCPCGRRRVVVAAPAAVVAAPAAVLALAKALNDLQKVFVPEWVACFSIFFSSFSLLLFLLFHFLNFSAMMFIISSSAVFPSFFPQQNHRT